MEVEDLKTGPKAPHSTTLTEAEETALQALPIGFFQMDIAEVQTAEGKLYLFGGIDRTSKFAGTQPVDKADRRTAWEFLEPLLKAVPYRTHTILTNNGIQFPEQPRNRNTAWSRQMRFDMICGERHRTPAHETQPPVEDDQVVQMNRTIKEATVKRFHCESHDQLRTHLADFMAAYNFDRRLKMLSGLRHTNIHALRIYRQDLDVRAKQVHRKSGLSGAATKHLVDRDSAV